MRSSISAQSWLSVPPAPGWMVTMALRASFSPESSIAVSTRSSSSRVTLHLALDIAGHVFAFARQLEQRVEIVGERADALVVARWPASSRLRSRITFWLFSGLRPEVGRGDLFFDFG